MRFGTFTDAFASLRKFRRVVTCYNWASIDAAASPFCLQICFDYNSIKTLHKCDETLLTVTIIAVSLTLK